METWPSELLSLLVQIPFVGIIIWLVLRWQKEQNARDDRHIGEYRQQADRLATVVEANTKVLERFCTTTEIIAEIRRVVTGNTPANDNWPTDHSP